MGKGAGKVPVVKYYMSVWYGVCHGPVDKVLGLYTDDKKAWEGEITDNHVLDLNAEELFGGAKKEGGLKGTVDFLLGKTTQVLPANVAALLGLTPATAPAARRVFTIMFSGDNAGRGFYWRANNPYTKGMWVKVQRRSIGLNPAIAMIGDDSNPAHILYEIMTNTDWGMGSAAESIDVATFEAAAQTLFDENFGLSFVWKRQASIQKMVSEVIDHINANLYVAPATGKWTLKLVRDDYVVDDLDVLDPDNCRILKFDRKSWGETSNEIVASWTNPLNEQEETVSVQDIGNISAQNGQVVSDGRDFYAVRNADLAKTLAERDLRVASAPLASFDIQVNRELWDKVTPGQPLKLNYPEYGIDGAVIRVAKADYGKPTDQKISFSATEDIFADTPGAFSAPPTSQWVDPSEAPSELDFVAVETIPYYMILKRLTTPDLDALSHPAAFAMVFGAEVGQDTAEFDLVSEVNDSLGNPVEEIITTMPTTSRATFVLTLNMEAHSTGVAYTGATQGSGPVVGGLVFIQAGGFADSMEIAVITAVGSGTIDLQRGALDTVPREFPAGTEFWFTREGEKIYDPREHADGSAPEYFALPRTSEGRLDFGSATAFDETLTDRMWLPLRPANVEVDGQNSGVVDVSALPNVPVTWANRNRLTEESVILAWDAATVAPEAGQTTTIEVRSDANVLLTTHSGLTGTSFDVPLASFGAETSGKIHVYSEAGGLRSLQEFVIWVTLV